MTSRESVDFGTTLKRAREARGVSLRAIADRTKISVSVLEAVERNDISKLPGGIFTRSVVRGFATECGLDGEQVIREFVMAFPDEAVTAGSPLIPQTIPPPPASRRRMQIAVIATLLLVPVLAGAAYLGLHAHAFEVLAPDTPIPQTPHAPAAATPRVDAIVAAVRPLAIELRATRSVSLGVVVDGTPLPERSFEAGERLDFEALTEMSVTMSDAGAVQLSINHQPVATLGEVGEVRTVRIGRENYDAFLAQRTEF